MNVQIVRLDPISIAMIRHTGPYDELSAEFDRLWEWVESQGIPAQRIIGIYYDNPDYVPANQLRSAACVEIPSNYSFTNTNGLPITKGTILGGSYATTSFTGPYEQLPMVWSAMTGYIENTLKRTISEDQPAFEVYVNDASETPPDKLITDLFMPVL